MLRFRQRHRSYNFYIGNYDSNDCRSNKTIQKMWDKISQMFLLGSLSGIAVLGDVIREYLLVNLIVLFVFVNMGIILIRIYLRKKFDCM